MTVIKVCGLTNETDMEIALAEGADYVGIVREPSSPRYVENPTKLAEMAAGRAAVVGVYGPFLDNGYVEVFDAIQTLSPLLRPNVLRVFRVGETPVENIVQDYAGPILLDGYSDQAFGGSGQVADWDLAAEVVERCQHPVFLAGGLTPENVAKAIRHVRPYGVDVSSGVEASPGHKDSEKVRAFIAAVRNV